MPNQTPSHTLLAMDPEAGLVLDVSGKVLSSNAAARVIAGADTSESLRAILPVNCDALVRASLDQKRAITEVECRLAQSIWLWTFIPDPGNKRVIARGREATAEIRKRDEATRASRLYRLITENTTDLISRHAPDGRFIDATPASWRLLGYWPEELRGRRLEDVFQGTTVNEQLKEVRTQLRDDGYATITLEIRHRDGSRRWFEIASRAIRETYSGAVVEVISVSRDITARVRSEENSRRLADELAHAARLATMAELASSIAHEMNQPLATIVNFASASQRYLSQAQARPELLERVDDGLQRIASHANRAAEVIKRLRAFLQKGHKRMAPIQANNIMGNAVRLCQWNAGKHGIRLQETPSPDDPVITADPVLLEQVLVNLLQNAIDATAEKHGAGHAPAEGSQAVITLSCRVTSQRETLIEVTDQGPGLDEQSRAQMFNPFYTSKPQGLGLGLSMSRSIIEGFGGFLDAHPADTGGLVLTCRFPSRPENKPDRSPMETPQYD